MTGGIHVSAVKVTAEGIRVDRNFEIRNVAVRTAAMAAIGRGQFVDEWLTQLVAAAADDVTATCRFGTDGHGVGDA